MNTRKVTLLPQPLVSVLVLVGPVLSAVVLERFAQTHLLGDQTGLMLLANLLIWSPLFFSIPALLMQDGRDQILPNSKSPFRGIQLLFEMARKENGLRTPYLLSLLGLAAAVLWSLTPILSSLQVFFF